MPGVQGVASGRVLSAGAILVFGAGLALFQLTSLLLGPVSSRQLDFSLTMPTVEGQEPEQSAPTIPVVGMGTTPAARATQVSTSPRAVSLPMTTTSSQPLPLPSPSPVAGETRGAGSHPAGKKPHRDR